MEEARSGHKALGRQNACKLAGEAGLVGGRDLLRGWYLRLRAELLPLLGVLLQMGLYLMVGLVSKGPNLL